MCGVLQTETSSSENNKTRGISKRIKCCVLCNKKFLLSINLQCHLRRNHPEYGQKCAECKKVFFNIIKYNNHRTYYHPDKSFTDIRKAQCLNCKARFFNKEQLTQHHKLCLTENVNCELCNQTFHTIISMKTHVLNDHLNLRFTDNECPWCKKEKPLIQMTYHILAKHTDSVRPVIGKFLD